MACPVCRRVYCDHTPADRGQTHGEMMADSNYGLQDGEDPSAEERELRATQAVEGYGPEALSVATALVGSEKAQGLIASLAKTQGSGQTS